MLFVLGIAAIALVTLMIGAVAVFVYVKACYHLQLALRTRTSIRNFGGELSMEELWLAISDCHD